MGRYPYTTCKNPQDKKSPMGIENKDIDKKVLNTNRLIKRKNEARIRIVGLSFRNRKTILHHNY